MTATPASNPTIAFIGGGNMARSLIGGLVGNGYSADALRVADPNAPIRSGLVSDFGIDAFPTAGEACAEADIWLFAVKPQALRQVAESLVPVAQDRQPLVISIAAGITSQQLDRWLGGGLPVVRAMPNTPALLGAGITGLYANAATTDAQRAQADAALRAAGKTVWVADEHSMDAVTAVSGSGPAYVFLLAEAMQQAGIAQGLSSEAARDLVFETILGAARMLVESSEDAAELRRRVTSPGGTTQAAIERLETGGLRGLVTEAICAAAGRGAELSAAND